MGDPGYSEVPTSAFPIVIWVCFGLVVALTLYLVISRLRGRSLRPAVIGLGLLVVLGACWWFLLAPANIPVSGRTTLAECDDPLHGSIRRGVPDDSTMSQIDRDCRKASRIRVGEVSGVLALVAVGGAILIRRSSTTRAKRN